MVAVCYCISSIALRGPWIEPLLPCVVRQDGEYVWLPREEALKHHRKNEHRDLCSWIVFGLFLAYFLFKMVPTIILHHFPNLFA